MSLIGMSDKVKPTLITGKSGTGKTTLAKKLAGEHIIFYANEIQDMDWRSVSVSVIVEDVHYKANKEVIKNLIMFSTVPIFFTSINEKDVSKDIKNVSKIKRAGTRPFLREGVKHIAPRSGEPENMDKSIIDIVNVYMKNPDRDSVAEMLKHLKPADVQIMTWLGLNLNPNKIAFIDGQVKRRWSTSYFYEMLAYAHNGRMLSKLNYPKRGTYSKVPSILRRLKLRPHLSYLLPQLLADEEFSIWAKDRLAASDKRIVGIKEKLKRNAPIIPERTLRLDRWF